MHKNIRILKLVKSESLFSGDAITVMIKFFITTHTNFEKINK